MWLQIIATVIPAFVIIHVFTSTELFIFSYGFELLFSILSFNLADSLEYFLQARSNGSQTLPAFVYLGMS